MPPICLLEPGLFVPLPLGQFPKRPAIDRVPELEAYKAPIRSLDDQAVGLAPAEALGVDGAVGGFNEHCFSPFTIE